MEAALRQPDIGDIFESVLVPAIFKPYAEALVERARPIGPSDRILDLGCGTGIVARIIRDRLGAATRISGLDASAAMIGKARTLAPELDWHEGNAMALPFADRSFDVVLSQQMLQFVPDRALALREIRRVLVPGGRLLVSTWRPRAMQPLFEELGRVAEKHLGESNDKRFCLDADELRTLLLAAGFTDVTLETCSLTEHYRMFPVRGSAIAANFKLDELSADERERRFQAVEADSEAVLAKFAAPGGGTTATSITNVAIATVP